MTTVHWKDIIGKDFMQRFIDMVKAEQYLNHKGLPWSTMADKFGLDDLQKYSEKRSFMRLHGWFKSYMENGELRFMSIHPIDRKYISLSQYLTARDAQRMADDEEEYYSVKDAVRAAIPKPRKDIDGDDDFVPEIEVTP